MEKTQTMKSRSDAKQLRSWDAARQQQYRGQHKSLYFHFLLDASPSMMGEEATALRRSFNMYLSWLQANAAPMSLAEVRCFSTKLDHAEAQALSTLQALTPKTYDPKYHGSGTALYRAIGETCTPAMDIPAHHLLIVFTDGMDNTSGVYGWTSEKVCTLLTTLQQKHDWLAVFLGAFKEAVGLGYTLGFARGNCLMFTTDQLPEAFEQLRRATQKYLAAAPPERKRLAAGGIF